MPPILAGPPNLESGRAKGETERSGQRPGIGLEGFIRTVPRCALSPARADVTAST
jgi:hypothetical protein